MGVDPNVNGKSLQYLNEYFFLKFKTEKMRNIIFGHGEGSMFPVVVREVGTADDRLHAAPEGKVCPGDERSEGGGVAGAEEVVEAIGGYA